MTADRGHSPIGASGYYRWRACPGSVRLCRNLPNTSSSYAAEGTLAHSIASEAYASKQPAKAFLGQKRTVEGHDLVVTPEMTLAVQAYLDAIAADTEPGDVVLMEVGFDLSHLYPELWGTADNVIYKRAKQRLVVRDFKYGAGVAVEVEANEQLMYYALGALLGAQSVLRNKPVREVELVIHQPRREHEDGVERRWLFDSVELIDFQVSLVDDARRTGEKNAPLATGDHCRWCPAKGVCPEMRKSALEKAKAEFTQAAAIVRADPTAVLPYDPAELADALKWADRVTAWANGVREFAYEEAMRGRPPPGFKLVAKRATRKWAAGKEAEIEAALEMLVGDDMYEPRSLRSPPQIEGLIGKKTMKSLAALVDKTSSGSTLAPESDERPAVRHDAASEFAALPPPKAA